MERRRTNDFNIERTPNYYSHRTGTRDRRLSASRFTMSSIILKEVNLADDSSDRTVWRFAQDNQMLLLTANRNAKGDDLLEHTIREESTSTSLPVITIGSLERLIEREYREQCSTRLVDIMLYLDNYLGVGRLFIP